MKTFIITTYFLFLISLFCGGCYFDSKLDQVYHRGVTSNGDINMVDYQGCEYLTRYQGAITHSETCKNPNHYKDTLIVINVKDSL